MSQPSPILTTQPVINSSVVIITQPIAICNTIGVFQSKTSFISPRAMKHIPPSINIVQCDHPRHMCSSETYIVPPIKNSTRYFVKSLIIADLYRIYLGSSATSLDLQLETLLNRNLWSNISSDRKRQHKESLISPFSAFVSG